MQVPRGGGGGAECLREVSSSRHWTSIWNGYSVGRLGTTLGLLGVGLLVLASSQDTWGLHWESKPSAASSMELRGCSLG